MATTYKEIKLNMHFTNDESPVREFRASRSLTLTQFFAGQSFGLGVQITLHGDESGGRTAHFVLTQEQAVDLAFNLLKPFVDEGDVRSINVI